MLYHLLAPFAKKHILFNLFNYITFRVAGAAVTALVVAFVLGPWIVRALRARKVGQVIRAEGPASHQGKRGTPTMGGLIILLATVVPTLLWARLDTRYVLVAVVSTLWMGAIGFMDDYLKVVRGNSQGLVARWKLAGQVSFGPSVSASGAVSNRPPNAPRWASNAGTKAPTAATRSGGAAAISAAAAACNLALSAPNSNIVPTTSTSGRPRRPASQRASATAARKEDGLAL